MEEEDIAFKIFIITELLQGELGDSEIVGIIKRKLSEIYAEYEKLRKFKEERLKLDEFDDMGDWLITREETID